MKKTIKNLAIMAGLLAGLMGQAMAEKVTIVSVNTQKTWQHQEVAFNFKTNIVEWNKSSAKILGKMTIEGINEEKLEMFIVEDNLGHDFMVAKEASHEDN